MRLFGVWCSISVNPRTELSTMQSLEKGEWLRWGKLSRGWGWGWWFLIELLIWFTPLGDTPSVLFLYSNRPWDGNSHSKLNVKTSKNMQNKYLPYPQILNILCSGDLKSLKWVTFSHCFLNPQFSVFNTQNKRAYLCSIFNNIFYFSYKSLLPLILVFREKHAFLLFFIHAL